MSVGTNIYGDYSEKMAQMDQEDGFMSWGRRGSLDGPNSLFGIVYHVIYHFFEPLYIAQYVHYVTEDNFFQHLGKLIDPDLQPKCLESVGHSLTVKPSSQGGLALHMQVAFHHLNFIIVDDTLGRAGSHGFQGPHCKS
ncbi:hypothetical protein BKA82DRAFT_4017140 [Pisolithus tinctorius]|nr:hypothetical protein BKA82DRAFT_4017140 [Pisolithus tinctorius]